MFFFIMYDSTKYRISPAPTPATKSDEALKITIKVADLSPYCVSLHSLGHMTCGVPLTGCSPTVNL